MTDQFLNRMLYLKAFQQFHAAGICHNDVRIDNIVINHADEVAVIDFDRATFTDEPFDHNEEIDHLKEILDCPERDASETNEDQEDVVE